MGPMEGQLELTELLSTLPLPLAQVLRRALNGKSAVDKHNNAFYLAEVSMKLAATLRIGLWLDRALQPGGKVAGELESLALPSLGHWLSFLRATNQELASRPDATLLPLGPYLKRLQEKQRNWEAVERFAQEAADAGVVSTEVARTAKRQGLLGFFGLVVSYRNEVMAHAAQRRTRWYERMGALLLEALQVVLSRPELFGKLRLVCPRQRDIGSDESNIAWQDLTGMFSVPLASEISASLSSLTTVSVVPGQLYFGGPGALVPLHPLAVFHEDEYENDAVGLLNKTIRRTRRAGKASVEETRRADYLNYTTGENLPGLDTRSALTALLGRLRDQQVSEEDLRNAEDRSIASGQDELPEDIVSEGAAIGDFELLEEIGRGGMGIVYKARQRSVNRLVALKVLPPALGSDQTTLRRFRQEVAVLARCDHPNVVRIFTSGHDGDRNYYSMEYVDGADLGQMSRVLSSWRSGGAAMWEGHLAAAASSSGSGLPRIESSDQLIPPSEQKEDLPALPSDVSAGRRFHTRLAELFADAASGIAHLHKHGVLHRDIKPGNLMLTSKGDRLVVMDLGLAKLEDASRGLTGSQVNALGTLRYMAPEQAMQDAPIDFRADIYGLGATLYELATGHPIFPGKTETKVLSQVLTESPAPPRSVAPSMPRDLATIITVATAKRPERRYPTAAALEADLRACAAGEPISASPPGLLRRAASFARRWPALTSTFSALLLVAIAAGLLWWNHMRIRVQLCVSYALQWEVPTCIRPASSLDRKRRSVIYKFYSTMGQLMQMQRVNSANKRTPDREGVAIQDFKYDAQGKVHRATYRDQNLKVTRRITYSDNLGRAAHLDAQGRPLPRTSTEDMVVLSEFDEKGRAIKRQFADEYNAYRMDSAKSYGYQLEYDDAGQLASRTSLDLEGEPMRNGLGWVKSVFVYDDRGHLTKTTFLDEVGEPALDRAGAAGWRATYDDVGNLTEKTFTDGQGKPLPCRNGYATIRLKYDARGNLIEERYFDVRGEPALSREGIAGWRGKYDKHGNNVERTFVGLDGKLALYPTGIAGRWDKYDQHGNWVESRYFDLDQQPTLCRSGYAGWRMEFDSDGNKIKRRFFDLDGKPALRRDGTTGWRNKFDTQGREVERVYLGPDGKPTLNAKGRAYIRRVFDARGDKIESKFFDEKGKPTLDRLGSACWKQEYLNHKEIKRIHLGIHGRPIQTAHGYAIRRQKYDGRGNLIRLSYFDLGGKLTLRKENYAIQTREYNGLGLVIKTRFFDVNEVPITTKLVDKAGWEARYDARGFLVEKTWLGEDGKPAAVRNGYATERHRYSPQGDEVERTYHDVFGNPKNSDEGFAALRRKYDARGYEIEKTFHDAAGKLVKNRANYAIRRRAYDSRGYETSRTFWGPDGERVQLNDGSSGWRSLYDARGYEIQRLFLGRDGKPVMTTGGYASWRRKLDSRGNEIFQTLLDFSGEPTMGKEQYATKRSVYDHRGRATRVSFHDTSGQLIIRQGGYAGWKARFDVMGRETERAYFGADNQPLNLAEGYATIATEYDEYGERLGVTYTDKDNLQVTVDAQ